MSKRILIVGGSGKIGQAVVQDLADHTDAELILAGRQRARGEAIAAQFGKRADFVALDLDRASVDDLRQRVAGMDLVLQCVGPFRSRPPTLLQAAIAAGVNYVDVCDDRGGTQQRLQMDAAAKAAGVTALIDTGTFPGIDNVLVAEALARHPQADTLHLSFVCAGSGGGGFGVLQTTFLAVSRPFEQRIEGRWQETPSYRGRRVVDFGPPLGRRPIYHFEVPEIWSLAQVFPQLQTITSRFGSIPELWNWATLGLALAPVEYRQNTAFLDRSAEFMVPYVHKVDRWVGDALGIRIDIASRADNGGRETICFYAPSTVKAVGWATGIAAAMVLHGEIRAPGVLLPETHIPPQPYIERLVARGGVLRRG